MERDKAHNLLTFEHNSVVLTPFLLSWKAETTKNVDFMRVWVSSLIIPHQSNYPTPKKLHHQNSVLYHPCVRHWCTHSLCICLAGWVRQSILHQSWPKNTSDWKKYKLSSLLQLVYRAPIGSNFMPGMPCLLEGWASVVSFETKRCLFPQKGKAGCRKPLIVHEHPQRDYQVSCPIQ